MLANYDYELLPPLRRVLLALGCDVCADYGVVGVMSKTKLHQMGYRKGRDCYFKTRYCHSRPENKVTVQVRLRGHGWYDVTALEGGNVEISEMLKGVRQLKHWEAFAFCS